MLVLLDGSDPTVASDVLSAVQLVGQTHGTSIRTAETGAEGRRRRAARRPIDVRTRVLYNPDLLSSYNIVPGLIAIILFQTATSLTALAIVRERERGTIEQLIVTPIRKWELVLAKMIPYILVSFADTILILLVGVFLFGVPIRGSLILLLALTGLYLLPTLGYGLVISTVAQTQQQAQLMIMPLMMPAFMLSGYHLPDLVAAGGAAVRGRSAAHDLLHLRDAGGGDQGRGLEPDPAPDRSFWASLPSPCWGWRRGVSGRRWTKGYGGPKNEDPQ